MAIKSYWETILEAMTSCCGRQSDEERERLLDESGPDAEDGKKAQSALTRWIALLSTAYYLPSNVQLYTAAHRVIAWIDRFANPGQQCYSGRESAFDVAVSSICQELQKLLVELARWITSADACLPDGQRVPSGNSREQVQSLVYHLLQFKGSLSALRTHDSSKAGTILRHAQQEFAEDIEKALLSSIKILGACFAAPQLEQLRHHGLIAVRELAANIAHSMEQTLAEVAAEVRPTDAEREHDPPKDFRNESDHTRLDAHAHETASPHESSSSQGPACAETSHENRNAAEHADRIWAEAAREMSRAVAAILNGDEAARLGALELVSLARKYCSPSHRDSEDVERSRQLYDDLTSRSEAAEDCIAHARSAGAALQEVLEGLAGGCSLQPLMQAFQSLYHEVEAELRTTLLSWLEDVGKVLTQPPPTLVDGQEDLSRLSERAVRQIKSLCDERPTVRQHISQILDSSRSFAKQISQERRLRKILGHSKCLLETICTYIRDQASHGRDEAQQLLHDVLNRLVPALLELIGHIMLPRIEYTSPNLDAALDNFIIESINLMPTDVHVQLSESLYWNSKHQSDLSISSKETRIAASGIGLAFKGISFFVREKVTEIEAPWSDTWCCRPLRKRPVTHEETSHIGAYREHGLLDVGIINDDAARQGAEVDIRLVPCKDQQHANGKPGLFSVERATVSLSADAFLFHLRKTRHKTLNKVVVDPFLVPILRLILQTAASTLLHRALQSLDSSLTRVVRSFKAIEENRSDTSPTWQDYIRAGLKNLVYSQDSEGRQDTEAARAKRASGPSEVNWSIEPEAGGIIVDLGEERRVFVGGQPTLLPTYAQGPATRWKTARQQATAGSPQRALGTLVGSSDASVVSQTQKAAHRVESAINDTRSRFQEFRSEGVVYEDLQAPHQLKHGSPWFHEDFDL